MSARARKPSSSSGARGLRRSLFATATTNLKPTNRTICRLVTGGALLSFLVTSLGFSPIPGELVDGILSGDSGAAYARTSKKRSTRKKTTRRSSSRSRRSRSRSRAKAKPKPPPKPTPEQLAKKAEQDRVYGVSAAAYKLYDEGVNARLSGNNQLSVARLKEAGEKLSSTKSYQKSGHASTLAAHIQFELGLSAEAARDWKLAKESYIRCLAIRPSYTPASLRLVEILVKAGATDMALSAARDAVSNSPRDPRAFLVLSTVLRLKGEKEESRKAEDSAKRLLKVSAQILPPEAAKRDQPTPVDQTTLPISGKIDPNASSSEANNGTPTSATSGADTSKPSGSASNASKVKVKGVDEPDIESLDDEGEEEEDPDPGALAPEK